MDITIETEREEQGAWSFDVVLEPAQGPPVRHVLRLSWADYDHWCKGAAAPASVARAVVEFLLQRESMGEIKPRIDASSVRRRHPEIDREIRTLIDD